MRQLLTMTLFVLLASTLNAQCDGNLAQAGSYEVTMNPDLTERTNAPSVIADCFILQQIEAKRRDKKDTYLEIDTYVIRIYSRDRVINLNNQEL